MSNVTPEEIVALTASAFGIPTKWMKSCREFKPFIPPVARRVAAHLLRKHKDLSMSAALRELGIEPSGMITVVRIEIGELPAMIEATPELADLVEQIEAAIDGIHERRLAEQEQHEAGLKDLGGVPPLTPEAVDQAFANATVR